MGRNLTSFSRKGSTFSRRRRRDAFSSIFDTWFDTQYLTGPDVCLWTRPKDHEQPFFSIFSCVIVDRLSRLIILDAAGCARKKEREREKEKSNAKGGMSAGDEKEYVYFQWNSLLILRWNYGKTRELFTLLFSFDSNPHSSIRSTDFFYFEYFSDKWDDISSESSSINRWEYRIYI